MIKWWEYVTVDIGPQAKEKTNTAQTQSEKIVCITKIKGNTITYYSTRFYGEFATTYGRQKKIKIASGARFYCYKSYDYDAMTRTSRCSKAKIQKKIKAAKNRGNKGFYMYMSKRSGKCTKLNEPYWP